MDEVENYTSYVEQPAKLSKRARSSWWIYSFKLGRTVVLGGYSDQQEAEQDLFAKLNGEGEVIELPTIDRGHATQMIKKKILDRSSNLEMAIRRASHQVKDR